MTDGPSAHLAWTELACKDGTPYPRAWRSTRAVKLARLFEAFRAYIGVGPLVVLSGYRTPEHNRSIGGARASQHVEGLALDIRTPIRWWRQSFHGKAKLFFDDSDLCRGLGLYPWGVHLDARAGRRVRWSSELTKDAS